MTAPITSVWIGGARGGTSRLAFWQVFRKGDIPRGRRLITTPPLKYEIARRWRDGSIMTVAVHGALHLVPGLRRKIEFRLAR
jgi:hypothetical protein